MNLLNMKIAVDTIAESGVTFDLSLCVGFTVINKGSNDCTLHYQGGPALMVVEKGTAREFSGFSGYTYNGIMQIKFLGGDTGDVEVIKSITSTQES